MGVATTNEFSVALQNKLLAYVSAADVKYDAAPGLMLFKEVPTDQNVATLGRISGLGEMPVKGEGAQAEMVKPIESAEAEIRSQTRSMEVVFSKEAVEDTNAAGQDVMEKSNNMAESYQLTIDRQCAAVLKSTTAGYDGQALFSASHPMESKSHAGATFSNILGTGGAGDAASGITDTALKAALTRLEDTNAFDENGDPIVITGTDLVCTTLQQLFDAQGILGAMNIPGNANNDANALRNGLTPILWRNAQQSTTGQPFYWYVAMRKKGLYYAMRRAYAVNTAFDPSNDTYKAWPSFRGGANWADFRCIVRHADSVTK